MSCEGRIVTEYSAWNPIQTPRQFIMTLCALSGHIGHEIRFHRNRGWWCEGTSPINKDGTLGTVIDWKNSGGKDTRLSKQPVTPGG